MAEPITREEIYLNSIANGESVELTPITREEMFLAKAGGQDVKTPTPITRKEMFLSKISSGGVQLQEKTVELTENGTTEITADEGKALSKVTAVVNVPTPTASKLPQVVDRTITELTAEDLEGATKIGGHLFWGCTNLTSVMIPNSVTKINEWAFRNCRSLTNITIPDSVTSIGSYAFDDCTSLMSVTIGNGVTNIGYSAFHICPNLTSVTIGDSVTSIDKYAFGGCSILTSITIPDNVTSIDNYALSIGSSTNKATITFLGTTPPSITSNAFNASKLEKIIVPAGCGEAYRTATNWANFADYIEEATV